MNDKKRMLNEKVLFYETKYMKERQNKVMIEREK